MMLIATPAKRVIPHKRWFDPERCYAGGGASGIAHCVFKREILMTRTAKASWPSQQLNESEMRQAILDQITEMACWRVGKYLGSMLYMDFGGEVLSRSIFGDLIILGEATLGIRDCYWRLSNQAEVIVTSETISDDNASEKLKYIEGMYLRDFVVREVEVDFVFSNNLVLSLDTRNRNEADSRIAEFTAPDGKIYYIEPDGRLYLDDVVSMDRFA